MAIIKSTDKRFWGRKRGYTYRIQYVSVYTTGNKTIMRIGGGITGKVALLHKCELSYDTDNRELIIDSNIKGNVGISYSTSNKVYNIINTFGYWNEAFGINAENGRYRADIDENDCVHVYFNERLT